MRIPSLSTSASSQRPALRKSPSSVFLNSSAIVSVLSIAIVNNPDENHTVAVPVNQPDDQAFYTLPGTLPVQDAGIR
jgi:hypothetical protein